MEENEKITRIAVAKAKGISYEGEIGNPEIGINYYCDGNLYGYIKANQKGELFSDDLQELIDEEDRLPEEDHSFAIDKMNEDYDKIKAIDSNPWDGIKKFIANENIKMVYGEDLAFEEELVTKRSLKDHEIYENIVHPSK